MKYYSGIDWSGDAGDPRRPGASSHLVVGAAHISESDLPQLVATLADLRAVRRLAPLHLFKYSGMQHKIRQAFFRVIESTHVRLSILLVDKSSWAALESGQRPQDRLDQEIANLVCRFPVEYLSGQTILIDRPRKETKAVKRTEAVIKAALRGHDLRRHPKITPCPDHRLDGITVQVADMFAGAVQDAKGVSGPYLSPLRGIVRFVGPESTV